MNKTILMGRVTKDVELKVTQGGVNISDFTVAVDRRFSKDKEVDFINCRAFRNTAEFISKWFGKGRMIAVVGSIQNNNWTDNNGEKHYATNVIVDEAYFCGDKQSTSYAAEVADINNFIPSDAADIDDFIPVDSDEDCPF